MPAPFSVDLRKRVIKLYNTGTYTQQEVSDMLEISRSTVKGYLKRDRAGKSLEPGQSPGRTPKISPDEYEAITQLVKKNADAKLAWFCKEIKKQNGVVISLPTMFRLLEKLGFTRKKKVFTLRSRIGKMSK